MGKRKRALRKCIGIEIENCLSNRLIVRKENNGQRKGGRKRKTCQIKQIQFMALSDHITVTNEMQRQRKREERDKIGGAEVVWVRGSRQRRKKNYLVFKK